MITLPLPADADPAASCSSGSASSTNNCCNIASVDSTVSNLLSTVDLAALICGYDNDCVICGESSNQNTVSSATKQQNLNSVLQYFLTQRCFGGQIARSPGSSVKNLEFHQYYQSQVCTAKCSFAAFNMTQYGIDSTSMYCDSSSSPSLIGPIVGGALGGVFVLFVSIYLVMKYCCHSKLISSNPSPNHVDSIQKPHDNELGILYPQAGGSNYVSK